MDACQVAGDPRCVVTELAPAAVAYRGVLTRPERWATWVPREGDILVATPPKSGTTWVQAMLAMLVHGGELPLPLGELSPWVDADLGIGAEEVARTLEALPGRRVVKTHTPADGFAIFDGVTVVAVYRHPLDVFVSLRRHVANRRALADHPMIAPIDEALRTFLFAPMDVDQFDTDSLASIVHHHRVTALSDRLPSKVVLHYADIWRDPKSALLALARGCGIEADETLIERVARESAMDTMRARAERYAPVGGTGFWKSDAAFFAGGGIRRWEGMVDAEGVAAYERRLATLIHDPPTRRWLEAGDGKA